MENIASLVNAIVAVPLLGMLFAALSREGGRGRVSNVLSVGIFTVLSNLVVLWRTALQMDVGKDGWKTVESFAWTQNPKIELVFGIDVFSLMLIAAVHLAVLLGMVGIRHNTYRQKALIVFALMFLSMISGYFLASDLFSFYIFFEALLLPLFMMVGIFGDVRKQQVLYRFFLYNLLGAVFLFVALVVLYNHENVGILEVSRIVLSEHGDFHCLPVADPGMAFPLLDFFGQRQHFQPVGFHRCQHCSLKRRLRTDPLFPGQRAGGFGSLPAGFGNHQHRHHADDRLYRLYQTRYSV